MKILLDENLPLKVKYDFGKNYEVFTVQDMGWSGKKNGELLSLAVSHQFHFLITLDKNLKYQQNIYKYDLKFIILLAPDNKHQTLQPYIERVKFLLNSGNIPKISEIALD